MIDYHVLGSIKEALHIIASGIYLMQRQNINLCLTVERVITPYILKALANLLNQVYEFGLDHDAEQQGLKKYKKQKELMEYSYDGVSLIQLGSLSKGGDKSIYLEQSRATYFRLLLNFAYNFGETPQDPSYSYLSLQLRTNMAMLVSTKLLFVDERYFTEMTEPEHELIQLAYSAHMCYILKPKKLLAVAIKKRVDEDHDKAFLNFKTKFDKLVRKLLAASIEYSLLKEQATKQLSKNYFTPGKLQQYTPTTTFKGLQTKCREIVSKLKTSLVKGWFGLVAVEFLADLFTGQREELMLKNQEVAS